MNDETEKETERRSELENWVTTEPANLVAQYILELETKLEAGTI